MVFYALGRAIGLVPPLTETAVAVPAGLVGSALPVSFGGWGAREISISGAYQMMGADFAHAVTVSLAYGLAALAFGLPGLFFASGLLKRRKPAPST